MEATNVDRLHRWLVIESGDLECSVCGHKWSFHENRPDVVCKRTDEQIDIEAVATPVNRQPSKSPRRKKPLGEEK